MNKKDITLKEMPVVALRGLVMFPDVNLHFDAGRRASVTALKTALASPSQEVFLVMQRDIMIEEPDFMSLHTVGVVAEVKQIIKLPGTNEVRVAVEGKYRARIKDPLHTKPYMKALIMEYSEIIPREKTDYETAMMREVRGLIAEYSLLTTKIAPDITLLAESADRAGKLADKIAGSIMLAPEEKQRLLTEKNAIRRLETLSVDLLEEIEIMQLEDDIHQKVQEQIDKNQREYYLREQLRVISEELNEGENITDEVAQYTKKIADAKMSEDTKAKLTGELNRYKKMNSGNPEAVVIRTYIDRCLSLPWGVYSKENAKLDNARKVLERDHYGLKEVKERIVEMLAARIVAPDIRGQIICLVGPPGVGKTSIARSIAKAMNRKYVRISLGGVRDEAEIRGHRRTYIGAIPGRITNALIDAKTANPLILLDEVDKLSGDFRGDPSSALLEVLDGEQNNTFTDHYIELPFDLSQVLFITTANDRYAIPGPLLDRMEVIELGSYTLEEKFHIAKKHLFPKQLKEHGLNKKILQIQDEALREIIDGYTREAGVRRLERQIAKICRKAAVRIADGDSSLTNVSKGALEQYLGPRKYRPDEDALTDEVALVNGLAWTSVGGELLKVEVSVLEGTGKIELTGSLGDVMVESAKAAVSFVRSRAAKYKIDGEFYKNKDIHIHFPEGAVPKDGPSAGITITTALVSALTGVPVFGKIAMTGEVTLRGRVLPIGGLKEKSMAAYRAGISTVIIPFANAPDLVEIDAVVREKVTFLPVKTVDEVLAVALVTPLSSEKDETGARLLPDAACTPPEPKWTT
ncbi:MAG: endopeptidase La [Oscillospiraceae bacterium]|jgi:ATP-dependent Lon protease|nr:endopeptidase La [Oscillospiraceae bacterium]